MFGDNDGYGGGGFDTSGFGIGDTPQGDKKGGVKRSEHLLPVTVRQVLQSPDTSIKIGQSDMESQMVKIVGIVKKIVRSSIKVIYTVEDNTGAIEGVHWLEGDADDSFNVPVVENTYCTMIGSVRNTTPQHNDRHIMVFQIMPIEDLNEVTQHTLTVVHIQLKSEDFLEKKHLPTAKQEMSSTYGGMDTSNMDYASGFNLNPAQQRVLKCVAQLSHKDDETGASVETIMNSLTVKMPVKEVEKILEFLSNEGHVYSTSDDRHFKATDAL